MRSVMQLATAVALATMLAGTASAVDYAYERPDALQPAGMRTPQPRAAITAALMNVLYLPVRVPITAVGAMFAGMTGWLTAGNEHAADDVFGLVDGTQVIKPAHLEKRKRFTFSAYD